MRARRLVGSYLALVQRTGFGPRLIGPTAGGQGTANRVGALLESTDEYFADPLHNLSAYQDRLNTRVAEVEATAAAMDLGVDPRHIVTGLYPLGDVNAWSTPANGGDLILMSSGALGLIFLTLKINMMSTPMFGEPALLDRDQTLSALADAFGAHFAVGDPWRAQQLPRLTGHRETLLALLVNATERFVIAHEYAHISAGHARTELTTLTSVDAKVDVYARDPQDEFEADRIAAHLVLTEQRMAAAAEQDPQFVRRHGLAAAAAATGPLYFLLLDLVLHELDGELKVVGYPPASVSNPPPGERWNALWPLIEQEYASDNGQNLPPLDLPGQLMQWFEDLFTDLVPAVGRRLAARG